MGLRISINIGQCPMGPDQPSTGQFTGRGDTPFDALAEAAMKARTYYGERPTQVRKWEAACSINYGARYPHEPADIAYHKPFEGEDHYNCALTIRERHKGVPR